MKITNSNTGLSYDVSQEEWDAIQSNPATNRLYTTAPPAEEPEEVKKLRQRNNRSKNTPKQEGDGLPPEQNEG